MITLILFVFSVVFIVITIYFSITGKPSRSIIAKIEPESEFVDNIDSKQFDSLQRDILKRFDQIKTLIISNPNLKQIVDQVEMLEIKTKTYLQKILNDELSEVKALIKIPPVTVTETVPWTEEVEHKLSKLLDDYKINHLEQLNSSLGNLENNLRLNISNDVNDLKETINQITTTVDQKLTLSIDEIKKELSRLMLEISTNINLDGVIHTLNSIKTLIEQPDTSTVEILNILGITKSDTLVLTQNVEKLTNLVGEIKTQVEKPDEDTRIADVLLALNNSKIENSQLKANITQVIVLIDEIKKIIEAPSVQVTQIINDLSTSKTQTLELKQNLENFKTIVEKPLNELSVIKAMLEPMKRIFDPPDTFLKYLKQTLEAEKNIRDHFVSHMKSPISDIGSILNVVKTLKLYTSHNVKLHIDSKERALKAYCKDLFNDLYPFRYVKYINDSISGVHDTNLPSDVTNVFFGLQKITRVFLDFEEKMKAGGLKLNKNDSLEWQQVLDKLIAVHKSILEQTIGIQISTLEGKIDDINQKTLDKTRFEQLETTFLNSADSNFQDLKEKIDAYRTDLLVAINQGNPSHKLEIQRDIADLRKHIDTQIASIKTP